MKAFVAVVAAAAVLAVACADGAFNWAAQNGAFTVEAVDMTSSDGQGWMAGAVATVRLSGQDAKRIIAGTIKYQLWESYVEHFVQQGSFAYFQCDNKGCDPASPVALHLTNPVASQTSYWAEFQFTMPKALASGDFRLIVWGQDQDHYPYDFSATVNYNYTSSFQARDLSAALPAAMPFTYQVTDGSFTINTVVMTTPDGMWGPGETATVTMSGVSSKVILAGTVKYQVYEDGMEYFVAQGNSEYFQCDNKGCNTNQPIALTLTNPTTAPSNFVLKFQFTMPKEQATGDFRLVCWGQDQDHYPYDFDVTINYNFTTSAVATPMIAFSKATSELKPGTIAWVGTNGNFTVATTTMSTTNGLFAGGDVATIVVTGECMKNIIAGTVQYQVYEQGVYHFTASGNAPYFTCNNKGCSRNQPVALTLASLSALPTAYTLNFQAVLPSPQATGVFNLVLWGVDQDHTPYDFDVTIQYNTTTTAL